MEPTTETVVDLNDKDPEKGLKAAEERLKAAGLPVTDENLFIAAACKDGNVDKGIDFLLGKGTVSVNKVAGGAKTTEGASKDGYTVNINGKKYGVKIEGNKATVNGTTYDISITDGIDESTTSAPSAGAGAQTVTTGLPGNILRINVSAGDTVEEGDVLVVVEAMKMETEIKSNVSGTIASVEVSVGDQVKAGQVLVTLN